MQLRAPAFRGDLRTEAHNEWTMMLFTVWSSRGISKKTGRPLRAASVAARVSLAKGALCHYAGFDVVPQTTRLKKLVKKLRADDPLEGMRRKRRALRARHLRSVWRQAAWEVDDWAALTLSWAVLARGAELADIRLTDVQMGRSRGSKYACVWVQAKKKGSVQGPRTPQYVAFDPNEGEWQPYLAIKRVLAKRAQEGTSSSECLLHTKRAAAARIFGATRLRTLCKRVAKIIGADPRYFGSHSMRIGGATDLCAGRGAAGALLLQAKGRWASDIGRIYARMTRRAHLAGSRAMFSSHGRDLEELLPAFAQPAL